MNNGAPLSFPCCPTHPHLSHIHTPPTLPAPPLTGTRNISNCLSIRTTFDRCSAGLLEHAKQRGLWDGQGEFDWAASFSDGGAPPLGRLTPGREASGHRCVQSVLVAHGLANIGRSGLPSPVCAKLSCPGCRSVSALPSAMAMVPPSSFLFGPHVRRLLQAAAGKIDPAAMMAVLRDDASGICMCDGAFRSNGSQVLSSRFALLEALLDLQPLMCRWH